MPKKRNRSGGSAVSAASEKLARADGEVEASSLSIPSKTHRKSSGEDGHSHDPSVGRCGCGASTQRRADLAELQPEEAPCCRGELRAYA